MEDLEEKHRLERNELDSKIIEMKRSLVGADKKIKKQINQDISNLEQELNDRHDKEIDELLYHGKESDVEEVSVTEDGTHHADTTMTNEGVVDRLSDGLKSVSFDEKTTNPPAASSITTTVNNHQEEGEGEEKMNAKPRIGKSKLKKQRKKEKFEQMRKEAAEEASHSINYKELEETKMKTIVTQLGLNVYEIPADGHCLYNAIGHQMKTVYDEELSYKELRKIAADYIKSHSDDFIPFLLTKEGLPMNEDQFNAFCHKIEATATWGGQIEIQALSNALEVPIHVIQADGPKIRLGIEEEEHLEKKQPLYLSYHRYSFGLGEHYNSLLKNL